MLSARKHRSERVYEEFNLFFSVVVVWGSSGEIESICREGEENSANDGELHGSRGL